MPTVVFLHARPIVEMATAARLPTMLPADWENYRPLLTYGSSLIDGHQARLEQSLEQGNVTILKLQVVGIGGDHRRDLLNSITLRR